MAFDQSSLALVMFLCAVTMLFCSVAVLLCVITCLKCTSRAPGSWDFSVNSKRADLKVSGETQMNRRPDA